jgi:hypothetical protein
MLSSEEGDEFLGDPLDLFEVRKREDLRNFCAKDWEGTYS